MVYLVTVLCSLTATVLLVAPVAMHRLLFRRHRLNTLVAVSHRCAYAGLMLLGAALTGVAIVVFGTVLGSTAAVIAGVLTAVTMLGAWVAYPLWMRHDPGCSDRAGLTAHRAGNTAAMLIRRVARPMLAAVFIGQGVDALRSPKPAADAARPTLEGLQKLPDPVGTKVPTDAETFAKVNAAVQIGGGLLLATGTASAAGVGGPGRHGDSGQPRCAHVLVRGRPGNARRRSAASS